MHESSIEILGRATRLFDPKLNLHCFGFETPLAPEKWIDLQFRAPLHASNLELLSNLIAPGAHWTGLSRFFRDVKNSSFLCSSGIEAIWIELDVGSQMVWPPSPNLFLETSLKHTSDSRVAEEIFFQIMGKPLPRKTASLVQKSLGKEFEIFGIGFMLARASEAIRISVRAPKLLPISSYVEFLRELGHCNNNSADIALLEKAWPLLHRVVLEMDFDESGVLPKIGWSLYTKPLKEHWQRLLDFVLQEELMDPTKMDAIHSWQGNQVYIPADPSVDFFYSPDAKRELIFRSINHIKLTTIPDHAPTAKIYLRVERISC